MANDKLLGPSYYAVALQSACDAINGLSKEDARAQMQKTIARLAVEVKASKQFIGPDLKLTVLPEYVLTAYPLGETIESWADKAALDMDGPEYAAISEIAVENSMFIAVNAYERDPNFPGIYFQACVVIGPDGSQILRYRRNNSMFAPTPHDVWDKYLDIYGLDGVFPVAKTEIGNLAAIASEEILYPEIARAHAVRGAEVFVHSTGEIGSPVNTPKSICRAARAVENCSYVVSANAGGIYGHTLPQHATDGNSSIIDYRGLTLVESNGGETMTAHANIDLHALRKYRRRGGMGNYLSRQRFELFAETYATMGTQPANTLLENAPTRDHFLGTQAESIKGMIKRGMAGDE